MRTGLIKRVFIPATLSVFLGLAIGLTLDASADTKENTKSEVTELEKAKDAASKVDNSEKEPESRVYIHRSGRQG